MSYLNAQQEHQKAIQIPQLISQKDMDDLKEQDAFIEKMVEEQRKNNLLLRENFKNYTGYKRQQLESYRLATPNKVVPNPQNNQKIEELNNKIIENQKIFKQVLEQKTYDVPEPGKKPTNAQKQAMLQKQLEIRHKVEKAFNIQKIVRGTGQKRKTFTYYEREQKLEELRNAMKEKVIVEQNIAYEKLLGRQTRLYDEYIQQLKPQLFANANSSAEANQIISGFETLQKMTQAQIQAERMRMTSIYEETLQDLEEQKQAKMEALEHSFDPQIAYNLIDDFSKLLGSIDGLIVENDNLRKQLKKSKTDASIQRNMHQELQGEIQILSHSLTEQQSKVETQIDEHGNFLDSNDIIGTARLQHEILQATVKRGQKQSPNTKLRMQESLRSLFHDSSQGHSSSKECLGLNKEKSQKSFQQLPTQNSFVQQQQFNQSADFQKSPILSNIPRQKLNFTNILQNLDVMECSTDSDSYVQLPHTVIQFNAKLSDPENDIQLEGNKTTSRNGSEDRIKIAFEEQNGSSSSNVNSQSLLISPPPKKGNSVSSPMNALLSPNPRQSSQRLNLTRQGEQFKSTKFSSAQLQPIQTQINPFHNIKEGNTASLLLTRYQNEDIKHQQQLQQYLHARFKPMYDTEWEDKNDNINVLNGQNEENPFQNYTDELKTAVIDALQEHELDKIQAAQAKIINFPAHLLTFLEAVETNLHREIAFRQTLGAAGGPRILKAETGLRLLKQVTKCLQAEKWLLLTRDAATLKRLANLGRGLSEVNDDDYDAAFDQKVALERAKAKRDKENPTVSAPKPLAKMQKQKFSSMVNLLEAQQTRVFEEVPTGFFVMETNKEDQAKAWAAKKAQITSDLKKSRMCLETDV